MKLKFNLELVCDFYSGGYCGDGGYRLVRLVGKKQRPNRMERHDLHLWARMREQRLRPR